MHLGRGILWLMRGLLPLATVALMLAPPAMPFCRVPQPRLVCAEYFTSNLVVEATLIRTEIIGVKNDPVGIDARVYTLRVNRVLRGKAGASIRVYEGNDSGRATFEWTSGRTYLLFLFYDAAEDKSWELDGCGNSGPLSGAKAALSQIESIKASHDGWGLIQGVVSRQPQSNNPIPEVRVEARGRDSRYAATANEEGEFRITVPAGRYVVGGAASGFHFDAADLSYEDPRRLNIEPGECAQVQLVGVESATSPSPSKH